MLDIIKQLQYIIQKNIYGPQNTPSLFTLASPERAFSITRDINSYYDSEKSFMTQKTFPKSVENSFKKINSEYIFVF